MDTATANKIYIEAMLANGYELILSSPTQDILKSVSGDAFRKLIWFKDVDIFCYCYGQYDDSGYYLNYQFKGQGETIIAAIDAAISAAIDDLTK